MEICDIFFFTNKFCLLVDKKLTKCRGSGTETGASRWIRLGLKSRFRTAEDTCINF